MNTAVEFKKISKNKDIIRVSRQEYEALLEKQRFIPVVNLTFSEKKALEKARREISKSAKKNLKLFHKKDAEKILSALEDFFSNPYSGDIEKIAGEENTWRRRVGNYRIIYDIDKNSKVISVRIISRRASNTY